MLEFIAGFEGWDVCARVVGWVAVDIFVIHVDIL